MVFLALVNVRDPASDVDPKFRKALVEIPSHDLHEHFDKLICVPPTTTQQASLQL